MSVKGKLLYGIGLNDTDYQVHGKRLSDNSIDWRCPYYVVWSNMLKRAYDTKTHDKQPTYKNCTVCKEWHIFSNFRKWMINQDWKNKVLDKDILVPGNKIYSPDTCCFVNAKVNCLLLDSNRSRGEWPKGIILRHDKFRVRCNKNGKTTNIGTYCIKEFNTAIKDYCNYKSNCIIEEANKQNNIKIKQGLILHSKLEIEKYHSIIIEYKDKINKLIQKE